MTGFSQPPDPDNDPVGAAQPAAEPMQPDERQHPTEDDLTEADEQRTAAERSTE